VLPRLLDRRETRKRRIEIAVRSRGLDLLTERGELGGAERAAVCFERMSGAARPLHVSGRRCLPKGLELARRILEKLVDQLREERLVAAHALAEIVQHAPIEYVVHGTRD